MNSMDFPKFRKFKIILAPKICFKAKTTKDIGSKFNKLISELLPFYCKKYMVANAPSDWTEKNALLEPLVPTPHYPIVRRSWIFLKIVFYRNENFMNVWIYPLLISSPQSKTLCFVIKWFSCCDDDIQPHSLFSWTLKKFWLMTDGFSYL